MWQLIVGGLVAVPLIGMLFVIADLFDAYNDYRDMIFISAGPVEIEQAKHTMWAQMARATILILIALLAGFELFDILDRWWIAGFIYMIAIVGVLDAYRARVSRKKMVQINKRLMADGE